MSIDLRIDGPVARITLNRPEKRNAIDDAMLKELSDALKRSLDARVVLVTGAGPDFCAGMDLAQLRATADAGIEVHQESARRLAAVYLAIRRHPRPVIAAVRGRALGGGAGLATACDAVLAVESARFGYPEVNIGFVPAIVMSIVRRSVGEKRAFDLLTRGESISAHDALELGLITRVFSESEFEPGVEAYAASLAAKSASAIQMTKRLLYDIDGLSFDSAIDSGVQINAIARTTEDARRGFERFVKKDSA
jgi:methylglutaconyl-CoA hydratase